MPTKTTNKQTTHTETASLTRPPVVVVMGHIDHGKSTLLDYIRKTNVVDKEVGGITQRMSSYEVIHKTKEGGKEIDKTITFLDTPGHESFSAIRARGASAADIAILVVSAEDGVKPQTLDALRAIKTANLPYVIGMSKIDKENSNIERTKQSLAENEIYVEGYGGDISCIPFSGKTGAGVDDLLDIILLTAEVSNFTADPKRNAEAIIVESNRDKIRGVSTTIIIKDGTLESGSYLVSGTAMCPVRILENFLGKTIKSAAPSQPVRVVGWNIEPEVGGLCFMVKDKKEAEKFIEKALEGQTKQNGAKMAELSVKSTDTSTVSILIKADTSGSVEAVKYEINKLKIERVVLKVIASSIGDIMENDVKIAAGKAGTLIAGFNVKADASSREYAGRHGVIIETFDIIYKLTEWLETIAKERTPKIEVEEQKGTAKILKIFSVSKNKQVLGARVEEGVVSNGDEVKIMRRDAEVGRGHIRELQHMKDKVGSVEVGKEFGTMIESKLELAPGDKIEAFHIVTK